MVSFIIRTLHEIFYGDYIQNVAMHGTCSTPDASVTYIEHFKTSERKDYIT
jgi:hypothetical protein